MENNIQDFYDHHYQDRGMKKWAGFMSAEAIMQGNEENAKRFHSSPEKKTEMTPFDRVEVLERATLKNEMVAIQLEELDKDGRYLDDVIGYIVGHDDTGFYINDTHVEYNNVRHIEIVEKRKWSEVN